MTTEQFRLAVLQGIPEDLPTAKPYDPEVNHPPPRKVILTEEEKKQALSNALRYFPVRHHAVLAPEFAEELKRYGHIYMYRFRPSYEIRARHINDYPHRSVQAAAIMLMLSNNLDPAVAQHPHELITYGGNGAVFQNWAQYLLTMKYLAGMNDRQTLVLNSGHPAGLFPSCERAPRVVISNGMMVPNYSGKDDYERYNALGVTQYGQMTAGSFMYIGPQGIVHGTTITVLNAGRKKDGDRTGNLAGKIFVTSGLGGMSGAQPKATVIAGGICMVAEVNPKAAAIRKKQGWVQEVYTDLSRMIDKALAVQGKREAASLAYLGNVVDLWEALAGKEVAVDLGSDQTSLHNPYAGGYYPAGLSFVEANRMMADEPENFKTAVRASLRRQVRAINHMAGRGTYFWDYGNAFLLEAGRAEADVFKADGTYRYPSYVQEIMGPLYFDFGFGPFRWVCTSSDPHDLQLTDHIAAEVLTNLRRKAPDCITEQLDDNIQWIREAGKNKLVVGSQARILYANADGRIEIARAFNNAIRKGIISAPVVLGRDHHDVSGTDSPFRETSDINDGSRFTADMALQNVIGDAFRGATWVSIHNGGGVGWGEAINGGFGMVLDGSEESDRNLEMMLYWDVNNGIARRSWAGNKGALFTIRRKMDADPDLQVTMPHMTDNDLIDSCF
jgi:urocanate hydratase